MQSISCFYNFISIYIVRVHTVVFYLLFLPLFWILVSIYWAI